MIVRRIIPLGACLGLALLGGCASTFPGTDDGGDAGHAQSELALRQSMQHVDAEMAELGQMAPAVADASPSAPGSSNLADPVMPADLQRIVSFDWSGPVDQAVAKLAASIGYTFYVTAPASDPPLQVSVRMSSEPVYRVFEALGTEAGTRATVEVDPLHHQVMVIHHVQSAA